MSSVIIRFCLAVAFAPAFAVFAQDKKPVVEDKKPAEKKVESAVPKPAEKKTEDKKPEEKKPEVKKEPPKPVEEALDRCYEASKNVNLLAAALREVIVDQVIGKKRERGGNVALSKEGAGGKFRIEIVGRTGKVEEVYLFDGSSYWKIDYKLKQITCVQQPAGAKPKDIFELGRGPFPFPVGQPREKILEFFDAELLSKPGEDPIRIKLKPKPGTPFGKEHNDFEFKAKAADGIPFEIVTRSRAGLEKTYLLEKIGSNDKAVLVPNAFKAPDVNAAEFQGWRVDIQQNQPQVGPPFPALGRRPGANLPRGN